MEVNSEVLLTCIIFNNFIFLKQFFQREACVCRACAWKTGASKSEFFFVRGRVLFPETFGRFPGKKTWRIFEFAKISVKSFGISCFIEESEAPSIWQRARTSQRARLCRKIKSFRSAMTDSVSGALFGSERFSSKTAGRTRQNRF